ncbi:MAG: hypothetical protein Q8N77_04685 [Nanoarchaeota archaeon]|nr:hypothetical protein [Nanoarchaeota archaeon]
MKKTLTAIIAASVLTLGSIGTGYSCSNELKDQNAYTGCTERHKVLVPGKNYATENILVKFDKGVTKEEATQFIKDHDLEMRDFFSEINTWVVKVPKGKEIEYVCHFNSVADKTIVEFAEPDYIVIIREMVPAPK